MVNRKPLTEKVLVLGVDGMDPRLTRKLVDEGKMPNVKKYIERGACREDLVLLGGHPTVTPPMWTTLVTGCHSNVHGITGFFRKSDTHNLDTIEYNLDSRKCKAEPVWNCFAETGKKTLVWHWPGSSWPPTSDNPNLMVVDGTSPGSVGMAVAMVNGEFLVGANVNFKEVTFRQKVELGGAAPCVITDLDLESDKKDKKNVDMSEFSTEGGSRLLIMSESQQGHQMTESALDLAQSPIKDAGGWESAPAGAKEFTLLLSGGLIRRPCLILQNSQGQYDRVAIYKSKKEPEPIVVMEPGVMAVEVIDEAIKKDKHYKVNRNMKLLNLEPDGSQLSMWVSGAMDMENDSVYSPKRLFKEITENVGYPTPTCMTGQQNKQLITDCMLDNWYTTADWQSAAILHLIESENLDAVFSHLHNIDLQTHMFIKHLTEGKEYNRLPHEDYVKFIEDIYIQTDYYLGKFIHLLDEGWTILITSDHAQVSPSHDMPFFGEISGVNVKGMQELGFTVLKKDENGNDLSDIDWTRTRAIAQRECHIYINLKGRDATGIVDPADQYELEEEIMTALYGYRDKKTGKRVIALALRNRDAVLLGLGGPDSGDICYWNAEGYNFDHADSLSTAWGNEHTSVSPIFIATGPGIREGYYTDRIIRQIDFAPTVAVLGGVRMPKQCEGAPAYQIFTEEY